MWFWIVLLLLLLLLLVLLPLLLLLLLLLLLVVVWELLLLMRLVMTLRRVLLLLSGSLLFLTLLLNCRFARTVLDALWPAPAPFERLWGIRGRLPSCSSSSPPKTALPTHGRRRADKHPQLHGTDAHRVHLRFLVVFVFRIAFGKLR